MCPVKDLPGALDIAVETLHKGNMVVGGPEIGFDLDGPLEGLLGLVVAAECNKKFAQRIVRVGLVRGDESVTFEVLFSLGEASLLILM